MLGVRYPTRSTAGAPRTTGLTSQEWTKRLIFFSVVVWGLGLYNGFQFSLMILTVMGLLLALLGLKYPLLGLFGVGILSTLDPVSRVFLLTGGLLRWNTFNYLLLLVTVLHLPFLLRLRNIQFRLLEYFAAWMLLQLVISPNITRGILHFLNFSAIFGLLIYIFRALQQERDVLHWLGLLNGTIAAIGGLVFYTQVQELPYINPNGFSKFPLMGLSSAAIALSLKSAENRTSDNQRLFLLVAVNFVWIFLSASRGSLLIATIVILLLALHYNLFMNSPRYVALLIFSSIIALGIISQFSSLQEHTMYRLGTTFDTGISLQSRTSNRSELAKGGWAIFQDNPFGIGTGGFSLAWTQLDADALGIEYANESERAAHSGWIKILSENGIIGFTTFGAFTASFIFLGWQRRREGLLLMAVLSGVFITSNLISSEFQSKPMWFLAATAVVLLHLEEMKRDWRDAVERRPVDLFHSSWHVHR